MRVYLHLKFWRTLLCATRIPLALEIFDRSDDCSGCGAAPLLHWLLSWQLNNALPCYLSVSAALLSRLPVSGRDDPALATTGCIKQAAIFAIARTGTRMNTVCLPRPFLQHSGQVGAPFSASIALILDPAEGLGAVNPSRPMCIIHIQVHSDVMAVGLNGAADR